VINTEDVPTAFARLSEGSERLMILDGKWILRQNIQLPLLVIRQLSNCYLKQFSIAIIRYFSRQCIRRKVIRQTSLRSSYTLARYSSRRPETFETWTGAEDPGAHLG
jgi:hypothetical protein